MATILGAVFVFLLVITLHELGHFSVAKLVGIKVNEFSIGMGPNIYNKTKGDTKYSLRALPIGGYVAMEGEEEDSNDPNSFNNAPLLSRIAVVVAGAFMNFILAILAFTLAFTIIGVTTTTIDEIVENSPAMIAGISVGDKIVEIDNKKINNWDDISTAINNSTAEEITVKVERGENTEEFNLTPKVEEGRKVIGIIPKIKHSFIDAFLLSFKTTLKVILSIFSVFKLIFEGNFRMDMLSGPVGVISVIGESTSQGIGSLLFILGVISANLGVINLLPIPALDGGKVMFLLIEAVRGKPIDKEKEAMITLAGLVLLFGLMIYVTIFSDLSRIFNRW